MRYFYVDRNWLDRAVDGAMSLGTYASAHHVFNEVFFERVYQEVDARMMTFRSKLRNRALPAETVAGGAVSGILFRSVIVSTWPGIEVKAYDAANKVLDILRMDRLAPDVLLILFSDVPVRVEMIEPAEGLHMGVLDVSGKPESLEVVVRGLGFANLPAGVPIPQGQGFLRAQAEFRKGPGQPAGVVNVDDLKAKIEAAMPASGLGPPGKLTPAGMGIELVLGAGLQSFPLNAPECAKLPRVSKGSHE
jgi:hypothetical protein